MDTENRDWGYDKIAGALANLGYEVSDQRYFLGYFITIERWRVWPGRLGLIF
jgi:hypothetical protein